MFINRFNQFYFNFQYKAVDDKILISRKLKTDAELNKVVLDITARKKEDETKGSIET